MLGREYKFGQSGQKNGIRVKKHKFKRELAFQVEELGKCKSCETGKKRPVWEKMKKVVCQGN